MQVVSLNFVFHRSCTTSVAQFTASCLNTMEWLQAELTMNVGYYCLCHSCYDQGHCKIARSGGWLIHGSGSLPPFNYPEEKKGKRKTLITFILQNKLIYLYYVPGRCLILITNGFQIAFGSCLNCLCMKVLG